MRSEGRGYVSANPVDKPRARVPAAAAGVALWLAAAAASAQFTQYFRPGSLAEPQRPTREVLEEGYSAARWKLGEVRIDPGLAITDLAYHNNVFAGPEGRTVSDLTATLAAGFNAYVHLGPKVMVSGFVRPQYVWWKELERLRELTESYGVGVFGYFNRMTLSLEARTLEQQRTLNSEIETPVVIREQGAVLDLEIELSDRVALFGRVGSTRFRHGADTRDAVPGLRLSVLDRDESVAVAGLAYEIGESLEIGLGVERSQVDFLRDPGRRSNSGTSPTLRIGFTGNRLDAEGVVVKRDLEFEGGAGRPGFDQATGSLRVDLRLAAQSAVTAYGARSLAYSALDERGTFLLERYGLSLSRRLRESGSAAIFAELGSDEYSSTALGAPRTDDYRAFGVSLRYPLSDRITLELGASEERFDSDLDEFDRKTGVLRSAVRLGGELFGW